MRKTRIVSGEHYHIYNRGNNKQNIFIKERDWIRFLFLILHFQSSTTSFLNNIGRYISYFVEHRVFNINDIGKKIIENRYVELISFAFMPNHFHLIVRESKNNGISQYMQRVLNAYTKYFNAKYEKNGHLFQGPFKIVHIENNEQLLHLSTYVHRNARELPRWKNKENQYPWSSYQDYINENRWGDLLKRELILNQFSTAQEYKIFTDTSGTKLKIDNKLILDC